MADFISLKLAKLAVRKKDSGIWVAQRFQRCDHAAHFLEGFSP